MVGTIGGIRQARRCRIEIERNRFVARQGLYEGPNVLCDVSLRAIERKRSEMARSQCVFDFSPARPNGSRRKILPTAIFFWLHYGPERPEPRGDDASLFRCSGRITRRSLVQTLIPLGYGASFLQRIRCGPQSAER